jgi:hypothetical protein
MSRKILKNPALAAAANHDQNDDDEERSARRKSTAPDQIPPQAKPPPSKKSKKGDDDGAAEKGATAGGNKNDRGGASAGAGGPDKSRQGPKAQMSMDQLSALYNQVLKLSTENVRFLPFPAQFVPALSALSYDAAISWMLFPISILSVEKYQVVFCTLFSLSTSFHFSVSGLPRCS